MPNVEGMDFNKTLQYRCVVDRAFSAVGRSFWELRIVLYCWLSQMSFEVLDRTLNVSTSFCIAGKS